MGWIRKLFGKSEPPAPPAISPADSPAISGCTIVRNAVTLAYPFVESIASYAPICREIILCWDPTSEDTTAALVTRIAAQFPQVKLVDSRWDLANRMGGSELARQTDIAFGHCTLPWTLYIQADEALHEGDHAALLKHIAEPGVAAIRFERRSFFRELDREITEHYCPAMVRLFRTGQARSVGDAMHCEVNPAAGQTLPTRYRLFNYSRLGDDDAIRTRSNNLNRFYHDDPYIATLDPDRNKHWVTRPFTGTHPAPIELAYRPPVAAVPKPSAAPPARPTGVPHATGS